MHALVEDERSTKIRFAVGWTILLLRTCLLTYIHIYMATEITAGLRWVLDGSMCVRVIGTKCYTVNLKVNRWLYLRVPSNVW